MILDSYKTELRHLYSYGLFEKKNESLSKELNIEIFVLSLIQNILVRKKNLLSKKPDEIKKNIQKKIEKKIHSLFFHNLQFSLENNSYTLSFLVFSLKANLKKKLSNWITGFLFKKPSYVYLWQICILWEWKNSKSFKNLDSLITIGLKSSRFNLNLLKEYLRFKIFFFKKESFDPNFYPKKKNLNKLCGIQILFVIFCSVLRGKFPINFISKAIQIYGKEIWSFHQLGKGFIQVVGLLKSKFSNEKLIMKVLNCLHAPFFFSKCNVTHKAREKNRFYLKVLNPDLRFGLFMLSHGLYLVNRKKHTRKSSIKKKNTGEFSKIDSFLR